MVKHAFLQHVMAQAYTLESTAKSNLQQIAGSVGGVCRALCPAGASSERAVDAAPVLCLQMPRSAR
jgi:hypothetical protein